MKKERFFDFTFLGLILLFLTVKLTMLLFGGFFRYKGMYYELLSGMIANGIIENRIFSPVYWSNSFYGGPIIAGFMAVPFFILFGKTLFSLRMASLIFSLSGFVMTYAILKEFFNKNTAVITGILYTFPPILFFAISSMNYGQHADVIIFNMTVLYLFYKIFFKNKKGKHLFILLGLVSGFGTYFLISHFIVVLCLLFFWYAFDKRIFFRGNFYLFLLFFIVGFSPWIIICHFESILRFGKPLEFVWISQVKQNLPSFFERFLDNAIFFYKSLFSSDVSDKIDMVKLFPRLNPQLYRIYFSIFLISYSLCLWIERHSFAKLFSSVFSFKRNAKLEEISPSLPVLIFPISFLLIYALTTGQGTNEAASRYFMPLYPFIFMIIAIFLDFLWKRRLSIISICFIALLTAIFLFSTIPGLQYRDIFQLLKTRGYGYHLYHTLSRLRYKPENTEKFLNEIESKNRFCKPDIYFGLGYYYSKKHRMPIMELEKDYLPFFYISLGYHKRCEFSFLEKLKREDLKEILTGEYNIFYFEGIGASADPDEFADCAKNHYPQELLCKIHQAAGFSLCLRGMLSSSDINMFDERYANDIYKGIGWCYGAMNSMPPDYRYVQYLMPTIEWMDSIYRMRYSQGWEYMKAFIERLPESAKKYFYDGTEEGWVAMAKLLKVCEYKNVFQILERDRLIK